MKKNTIKKLNKALRGERSAVETYQQVLEKVGTDPRCDDVREIKADHIHAATELKSYIQDSGQEADSSSGAWGSVAKTVTGTAKIFGDRSALKALKEGEEHGLKLYEDIVDSDDIQSDVRSLISMTMIPKQKNHINKLDTIMGTMQ